MKHTSTPPETENHKHYILSPLVASVRRILRKKVLLIESTTEAISEKQKLKVNYSIYFLLSGAWLRITSKSSTIVPKR